MGPIKEVGVEQSWAVQGIQYKWKRKMSFHMKVISAKETKTSGDTDCSS